MNTFVPDELKKMAETYKERNLAYGNCYKEQGKIMRLLFPKGITLVTPADQNRYGILMKVVDKVFRYSCQFKEGGHRDSLHDISVYCAMLQELDHIESERSPFDDTDAICFRDEAKDS